jgi:hypothetical protein
MRPNGCAHNRAMPVGENGGVIWRYGKFGVSGSGPDRTNTPVQGTVTPDHALFITD